MYPKGITRGEPIVGRAHAWLGAWVERDGLSAVVALTNTSPQTVAKALAGLPVLRCSRKRLLATYPEVTAS
jgi:hypothetical protein